MIWKDTTSYSRDATGPERVATTWSAQADDLRITITIGHIYHKGSWVMHCRPWFDTRPLPGVATKEAAQAAAIKMVRAKLLAALAAIGSKE